LKKQNIMSFRVVKYRSLRLRVHQAVRTDGRDGLLQIGNLKEKGLD